MKYRIIVTAVLSVLLGLCVAFAADAEIKPGEVTAVQCKHNSSQSYACYLPSGYTPSKKWPILYCFSPNANGGGFVDHYKDVCEKHQWIVVGSNNAKNGPWEPIQEAMDAMWKDTQERFSTSSTLCYATGWSGGSGVAFDLAINKSDRFAGVIPIAAGSGWDRLLPRLPKHISVYFIMGDQDSAPYVKMEAKKLRDKGNKAEVNIFSGGHVWPPKETVEAAVEWLVKVMPKPSANQLMKELTQLELKDGLAKKLKSAVKKVKTGDFKGAISTADKMLQNAKASDQEKEDAAYIKETVTKHIENMFAASDDFLEKGLPYEAKLLLENIKKSIGGEDKTKAQDKVKEISSNKDLKDALKAGKLYYQAVECEATGQDKKAKVIYQAVVKKHPNTEYGKMAKDRIS
ncbi:hypothetical protein ACFL54_05515 [Planctomycetota bacterium]